MENKFYTLPSDEADSRKLASDADRSCESFVIPKQCSRFNTILFIVIM